MTISDTSSDNSTILIIDDDWMNRELLSTMFKAEDFAVLEASNGEKGLELAAAHQPAAIILDVRMPDLDGYTVCRQIKANPVTEAIPVIMMSGLDDDRDRQAALDAGAATLLSRFQPLSAIVATIREHVSTST